MKGIAQTQSFASYEQEGLHIKAQTLREIPDA